MNLYDQYTHRLLFGSSKNIKMGGAKNIKMGGACGTYGGKVWCVQGFGGET